MLSPFRTAVVFFFLSVMAQFSLGSQKEAVNWRVWNAADGMLEGYVSQVSRTPSGKVLARHGDLPSMDILDGFSLSHVPDVPSLGTVNAVASGELYTFDKTGAALYLNGKWYRYPIPEVASFNGFGTFAHLHWFKYPFKTDLNPRISALPFSTGNMLFCLAGSVIAWSSRGPEKVLRESAKSGIGDFVQISPTGDGAFFISGVHGLARLSAETSGWTEFPKPPHEYTRFVFPSQTKTHGILTSATAADGRKVLLSLNGEEWKVLYTAHQPLRGWETGSGQLWAMEPDKLLSLSAPAPHRVDLDSVITGTLYDVAVDGDAFWLASSQGVARYAPPLWQVPSGFPELRETVNTITQDAQGTLWFTSGSSLLSYARDRWKSYELPAFAAQDTSQTSSVCPMNNGHLLLLTNNLSHLLDMNVANASFRSIVHPEGRKIGFIERRDGNSVWVQSVQSGESTSRIEIYDGHAFLPVRGAEAIPTTDVRTALMARDGVLWVGGTGNLVRIAAGRMQMIPPEEGLPEASAFSLVESPDGTIYVGHRDAISAYKGSRFRVLRKGFDRARRFSIARDGTLWAASTTGVHRYQKGVWLTNSSEEGLPSDAAYTVFADREGQIWAGTTLGLSVYHPESDLDPPLTTIQEENNQRQAPPGGEVRFAFSGADRWKQTPDARLLFSWKLDTGAWSTFQSGTLTALQNVPSGSHLFQVRAMDRNGNVDPHPAHFSFTVLFPWYRETGFYFVSGLLGLAILVLLRTGYTYHSNLRFQSRHDPLTGLPNRLQFEQTLAAATTDSKHRSLAVLFFDLDGFKGVNDTQGHPEGDKLLVRIGTALRSRLAKGDLLARIGGDEFAILHFSEKSRATATLLADVILESVRACSPNGCNVSASIGISLWPEHGLSPCALVRLADLAMYQSKSRNGDCGLFYEPAAKLDFRTAEMAGVVRAAIAHERLVLWYQPIINGEGGVARIECLVRIDDPSLGLIEPTRFIKVTEDAGLIEAVGRWVLQEAANTAAGWRESGCKIPVAVNISPLQLEHPGFAAQVLRLLEQMELPPSALTLEVTEGAVARNQELTASTLNTLRNAGISIALDDFGTGYSGLSMLETLPINEIKLDLSFAATLSSQRTRDVVAQSVILAHKLNLKVTMEGIEEQGQFEIARELGCDWFQGYLIAPPLDHEMATQFLLHQSGQPTLLKLPAAATKQLSAT